MQRLKTEDADNLRKDGQPLERPDYDPHGFGSYLKQTRESLGFSVRSVEARTRGRIRNAYLSQIENGRAKRVNMEYLIDLAHVYGLDLWNLMYRAGYPIPEDPSGIFEGPALKPEIRDLVPLSAFDDLTEDELEEVIDYIAFIKRRRRKRARRQTEPNA